jgi:hypothetical protein
LDDGIRSSFLLGVRFFQSCAVSGGVLALEQCDTGVINVAILANAPVVSLTNPSTRIGGIEDGETILWEKIQRLLQL